MKRLCSSVAILSLSLALCGGTAVAQSGGGSGGSSGGGAAGSSSSGNAAAQSATPSTAPSQQQSGSTSGSTSDSTQQSGTATSDAPGATVRGPNNTGGPVPGLATPSISGDRTVGRAPGVNPGNPQDASRRGNPSDRTLPGASNPQDMKAFDSTPQIIVPERRR